MTKSQSLTFWEIKKFPQNTWCSHESSLVVSHYDGAQSASHDPWHEHSCHAAGRVGHLQGNSNHQLADQVSEQVPAVGVDEGVGGESPDLPTAIRIVG